MKEVAIAAWLFGVVLVCSGCGPSPTAYEGRWVEGTPTNWSEMSDELFRDYTQEYERHGGREFLFTGDKLTVSRQGIITRFVFEVDAGTISSEPESLTANTTLVLRKEDDYEESRVDVVSKDGNCMRLRWPTKSIVLKEWSEGDRTEQIVKVFYDPIELVRVDD